MLLEHSARHGIALWHAWGRCFAAVLQARRGDLAGGLATLRTEFTAHPETRVLPRYSVPQGGLYLVQPAARQVPRRVAAFRDFVLERLASHPLTPRG